MYRFLSRTVWAARIPSFCVYEPCPDKCETLSRVFSGAGVNALSTSSFRLYEKKDPSSQGETKGSQTKINHEEEPAALKVDDGGTSHQEAGDKAEQVSSKPKQVKAAKNEKQNLLDLLQSIKVQVTRKERPRSLDLKKIFESAKPHQSKQAVMERDVSMFQKATAEVSTESETLDPNLVAAASAAASTLPNRKQAASELLRQLRERKTLTEAQRKGDVNILREVIADMKVRKRKNLQNTSPTHRMTFYDDDFERGNVTGELAYLRTISRSETLSKKRLDIFSPAKHEDVAELAVAKPTLWDIEFANELSQAVDQSPSNLFEEMIQWTREGKLWQYPINNESGLEEEASVPFQEHIFLEEHLKEGFPDSGPVRHFMELVVAGLSRNPYLSVQQKKEHIAWFRDYFHQKEEVLNDANIYLS